MKIAGFLVGTGLVLLSIEALRLEKQSDPAVLQIPLQKRTHHRVPRSLSRRQGEVQTPDVNYMNQLLYIVQLEIGTPPQSTYVQLDTGSSDLVVETDSSNICTASSPNPCTNFGAYDANSSSTYQYMDSNFEVAYGGGDGATGDWVSDIASIGGATLQGAQFGVMYQSTILEGILGVSYQIIEGRYTFSGEPQYDNFPVLLVKQGYIASRAFSLYTNDDRSASGTLLFGGIDTDKFSGELVTIDLVASGFDGFSGVVDFTLSLNSVSGTGAGGNPVAFTSGTTPINVLMDSGTTITQLPAALVASIWTFVGATPYSNDPNSAYVPCSLASSTETINFGFNGITIKVPLSQLAVFPDSNNDICFFGIQKGGSIGNIIGDTILAAMYIVYDLDNNQISLAPTVFNSATENILQIMAGPGGVPDTFSSTSSSSSSTSSTATSSSTSSSITSTSSSSSSSSVSSSSSTGSSSSSATSSSSSSVLSSTSSSSSLLTSSSSSKSSSLTSSLTTSASSSTSSSKSSSSSTRGTTSQSSTSSSSTMVTSTSSSPLPTTIVKPLKCNMDNCLRAMEKASATAFCSAIEANIPVSTPTAIANGCQTLASRISSGCACYYTATGGSPITPSSSTGTITSILSTSLTSTTKSTTKSTTSTTAAPKPMVCNKDNCLRAMSRLSPTSFCDSLSSTDPLPVPTAIANGCASSAPRISSACACVFPLPPTPT